MLFIVVGTLAGVSGQQSLPVPVVTRGGRERGRSPPVGGQASGRNVPQRRAATLAQERMQGVDDEPEEVDHDVTDDVEDDPIVYVSRKKIIRIEEYYASKRVRSSVARRYHPGHRLYHTHAVLRYELYPPEMEVNTRNELYAYAYPDAPAEESGSGGEEDVPEVEVVNFRPPTIQRGMDRSDSWTRIDGSGGSQRGLLWQIPDHIRARKFFNERAPFACSFLLIDFFCLIKNRI